MEDDEVDEAERLLSMVQDEIDFEREEEKELAKARAERIVGRRLLCLWCKGR